MKKLVIIFSVLFIFCGCKKVFKEDTQNEMNIADSNDLTKAVAGLNYQFANSVIGRKEDPSTDNYSSLFFNSDDGLVINGGSDNSVNGVRFCIQNFGNDGTYDKVSITLWKNLYRTIMASNDILKKSAGLSLNNIEIKNLLGEVYFFRAYTYYRLVRFFGQVPLVDNVDINYTIKKPSFNDIYNFIIADLKKSMQYLPVSNYTSRIPSVTPNRGTAKALLAEVYLTMAGYPLKNAEMYNSATLTAKEVIDSASFFGYQLLPDLNDLWNGNHERNTETVYALYLKDGIMWDTTYFNGVNYYWGIFKPTIGVRFYNNFTNNYRKKTTYRTSGGVGYNNAVFYDTIPLPVKADMCSPVIFRKFYTPSNNVNWNYIQDRVIYLLRYARTLLTYAEAKARSGNLDASAYEAVNMVRRRANKLEISTPSKYDLQPGLTSRQFADSVVWERAQEFCGEPDSRIFDLVRLEMLRNLTSLKVPHQGSSFPILIDTSTLFFPIPEGDSKLNPNLK